ncbi:MAG TPA: hypothetical protein VGO07_01080 [Candidatus Saccharimonadales bacterium]|jgi:hypothetical protein|nr:hypothetical protein [Candidatus Saccharimonadales bacterium]
MPQFETPDMTQRFPGSSRPQQLGHFIAETAIAPEEPEDLPDTDAAGYPEITATEDEAPAVATVDDDPAPTPHNAGEDKGGNTLPLPPAGGTPPADGDPNGKVRETAEAPQPVEADEHVPATQDDKRALGDSIRTAVTVQTNSDPEHSGSWIEYEQPRTEADIPLQARELLATIPANERTEIISYAEEKGTSGRNSLDWRTPEISRIAFLRREREPDGQNVREVRVDYTVARTSAPYEDPRKAPRFECERTVQAVTGPEEHLREHLYYGHDLTVDTTRTQELDHAEVAGVVQHIRESEPETFNDAQEYGVRNVPVTTEDLRTLYDTAREALAPAGSTERSDTGRAEQERPIAESDIPNRARRFLEKVSIGGEAEVVSYVERLVHDDADGHIAVQFVRREENSTTGNIRQWQVDYTINTSDLSTVPRDGIRFTRGAEGRYDPARTSRDEFLASLDTYDWNTDSPTHAVSVYDHSRDTNTNFNTPLHRSELNEVVNHLRGDNHGSA